MNCSEDNRGKFQREDRARQLVRFDGLRYGTITPTDVDMFIEYNGKAFVLAELKHRDAPMPRGQELALTRTVDALSEKAEAVLFVCEHEVDDTSQDIVAADTLVRDVYYHGRWRRVKRITLKEATDSFISFMEG